MKIYVTLDNGAGFLDSIAIDTGRRDAQGISAQIMEALHTWTLAPGDIIRIIERE